MASIKSITLIRRQYIGLSPRPHRNVYESILSHLINSNISRNKYGEGVDGTRNAVRIVVCRTTHASNCVSVKLTARPLCLPWPIYDRRAVVATVHLIYRRPANLNEGPCCRRPNKAHSHATERTRTLACPYLNWTIVSHSFPPDILRRVIRYDTVRLFLQFSHSFFSSARYCSLVNFFS